MGLFGFGKKKESKCSCTGGCSCSGASTTDAKKETKGAYIKVLGGGCASCNDLEAATKAALEKLGMNTEIEHITDFSEIASYGVMSTPALVIGGKVVSTGRVLKAEEVEELLKKER